MSCNNIISTSEEKNNIISTPNEKSNIKILEDSFKLKKYLLEYINNTLFQIVYALNRPMQLYTYEVIINCIEQNMDKSITEVLESDVELIKNPIFIVGCGHSGTTLFNKLLGHHSNIYSIPDESSVFIEFMKINKINKLKIFKLWSYLCIRHGKKRWCEKTPRHIYHINDIFKYFPDAKVIILTRNGKAVSSSIKERVGTFIVGVKRWLEDNEVWMENKNKDKCLVIKYEDVVRNTINTFKKVCKYLEEEYEDLSNTKYNTENIKLDLKSGLINNENHANLRKYQINQLIYDNIEESNNKMNIDDKFIFNNIKYKNYTTEIMLKNLGYN
jgi:hypothetical protein